MFTFKKMTAGSVAALLLVSTAAFARNGAAVVAESKIEALVVRGANEGNAGKTVAQIRAAAVESLRLSKQFTAADLKRVSLGQRVSSATVQEKMIQVLSADEAFKVSTGLQSMLGSAAAGIAGDAMAQLATNSPKEEAASRSVDTQLNKIRMVLGNAARTALEGASKDALPHVLKIAMKMVGQVQVLERQLKVTAKKDSKLAAELSAQRDAFVSKMAGLLHNLVAAYRVKGLEKTGLAGAGLAGACADPKKGGVSVEAKNNYADLVEEAANGNPADVVAYVKALRRAAVKKFGETQEAAAERVKALSSPPCQFFAGPIAEAL